MLICNLVDCRQACSGEGMMLPLINRKNVNFVLQQARAGIFNIWVFRKVMEIVQFIYHL